MGAQSILGKLKGRSWSGYVYASTARKKRLPTLKSLMMILGGKNWVQGVSACQFEAASPPTLLLEELCCSAILGLTGGAD